MEIIRAIGPYKTDLLTDIMQVFSVLGDGDCYFYCATLCLLFDNIYDFCYLTSSLFMSGFWVNFLKVWFQDSRPQFDDPQIAETNQGICAGEFGNPSGHALLSSNFCITVLLFYSERFQSKLSQSCGLRKFFFHSTIYLFVSGVCLCRLYLGRHSIDQILNGVLVGTLNAFFF